MELFIDTETYSETPISHGMYRYIEDSELMLTSWAVDDERAQVWDATQDSQPPGDLCAALMTSDIVIAHNAMFDRNVIARHLPDYAPPLDRWRCSMVRALAHSLPAGLDAVGAVLGLGTDLAKIKDGRALMLTFCKPRPKSSTIRRATRLTDPEKWAAFVEYARQDVVAMRAVWRRLPEWNYGPAEISLYHLDQVINDRGMYLDLPLIDGALDAIRRAQADLRADISAKTNGDVPSATQRDVLLGHILSHYGVPLPDLQKDTILRRLADEDLPDPIKELLRIRLQATTSSTSKYAALKRGANSDGRLRGTLQFDGASRTGRASGRTFQPQNLPSRGLPKQSVIDTSIEAFHNGVAHLTEENVMQSASHAIRGSIIAPPGYKLVVADLANIEGRLQAWLAGEAWKLDAFREYDAGTGPDLYKLAYARSFGIPHDEVTKGQRQQGKVLELACGYQGGVGAFLTFAAAYNLDLVPLARSVVLASGTKRLLREARDFWAWTLEQKRDTYGLSEDTFVGCDILKRAWRGAHPETVGYWRLLQDQATLAIQNPGTPFAAGPVTIVRQGGWLRIVLPSGRSLSYASPRLDGNKITYMGINQYTRKWARVGIYGGKFLENICQAVSRDVLYYRLPTIEAAGYQIILTVHDEVVAEAPDTIDYGPDALAAIMAQPHDWTKGLPLAAAGFESYRYKKGD